MSQEFNLDSKLNITTSTIPVITESESDLESKVEVPTTIPLDELDIDSVVENTSFNAYGINTPNISVITNYPTIEPNSSNYKTDVLIINEVGFSVSDIVDIFKDGTLLGSYTIPNDAKAIYLSEIMGVPKENLNSKSGLTETYEFVFLNPQLLKFQLITSESFTAPAQEIYENELPSGYYLLGETLVDKKDESSVSAIRHAIDNTDIEVTMKENSVLIEVTYPEFGTQLPISFYSDYLISFEKTVPMGTEVAIKKDGVTYKTVTFERNTEHIWLYDLLGETKPTLSSRISENWEFQFVYNQTINVQAFAGEVASFLNPTIVIREIPFGLFELANSDTLSVQPEPLNSRFLVDYENYTRIINRAKVDVKTGQYVTIDFVENMELDEKYIRIHNHDKIFNVSIDLIMRKEGVRDLVQILQDMSRQLVK